MLEVEPIGHRMATSSGRNGNATVAGVAQDHIFNKVREGSEPAYELIFRSRSRRSRRRSGAFFSLFS